MSNLWMRKYEFICKGIFTDPLTVKFSIPFSDTSDTTATSIKVYNLKDETIKEITVRERAILNAGYVADYGAIFTGYLKNIQTQWEGVDKVTTFTCADAPTAYLKETFKKTYAKNTKASLIAREVAAFAGLKIGSIALPVDFTYRRGKTLNGKPKTILEGLAKDCKAKMHITKGALYMVHKNAGIGTGIEISKETGLINHPERIEDEVTETVPSPAVSNSKTTATKQKSEGKDTSDKKKDSKTKKSATTKKTTTRTGYKLKMLLNPRIDTDVIILLKSKTVTGTFRVEKGEHKGDSSGNEWFTECEVYPV
ncbi:phage protein [Solibacillus isronensis]|uniref:phage protein n=1 Tax=Solibacillus isronensis TaxID=412383 RepID=UPI0039A1F745